MGQSTDAILFYGYCWDVETSKPWLIGGDGEVEDNDLDEDEDEDWEDRYAQAVGIKQPTSGYPEGLRTRGKTFRDRDITVFTSKEQLIVDDYRAYWKAKGEAIEAANCEVSTHCSGECPMPYVAIKASKIVSRRGYMSEVSSLAVDPEWNSHLAEFCLKMGIIVLDKPRWWLVSDWC